MQQGMVAGPEKRYKCRVLADVIRDGRVVQTVEGENSRPVVGGNWQAAVMWGSAWGGANYVACGWTPSTAMTKDSTTLDNEFGAVMGLQRAVGATQNYVAPSTNDGAASYEVYKSFSVTGTTTVYSSALFTAASGGTMFVYADFGTAASVASGDTLNVTWTVNL